MLRHELELTYVDLRTMLAQSVNDWALPNLGFALIVRVFRVRNTFASLIYVCVQAALRLPSLHWENPSVSLWLQSVPSFSLLALRFQFLQASRWVFQSSVPSDFASLKNLSGLPFGSLKFAFMGSLKLTHVNRLRLISSLTSKDSSL